MNMNTLTDPNVIRYGIYKQNQYIDRLEDAIKSRRIKVLTYNEGMISASLLKHRLKTRLRQLT